MKRRCRERKFVLKVSIFSREFEGEREISTTCESNNGRLSIRKGVLFRTLYSYNESSHICLADFQTL